MKKNKWLLTLGFISPLTILPLSASCVKIDNSKEPIVDPKQPSVPNMPEPQPNPNPITPDKPTPTTNFDIETIKVGDRLANGDVVVNLLSHSPDYFGRYFQHNPEELIIKDNNGVFKIAILNLQSGDVIKHYQVGDVIKNIGTKDYTLRDVDEHTGKFYDKVVGKEIIFKDNALGGLKWIGHFNIEYAVDSALDNNKKYAYQEGDVELQRDVIIQEIDKYGYELANHYTEADLIDKAKQASYKKTIRLWKENKSKWLKYLTNYSDEYSVILSLKENDKLTNLFINFSNSVDVLTDINQIDAFVNDLYHNNKTNETLINFVKQELIKENSKYNFKTILSAQWLNDNEIKQDQFILIAKEILEKDFGYNNIVLEEFTFKEALIISLNVLPIVSRNADLIINSFEKYLLHQLTYHSYPLKNSPTYQEELDKLRQKINNYLINNDLKDFVNEIKTAIKNINYFDELLDDVIFRYTRILIK